MNISVNWIKEFVAVPELPPEEIAERITTRVCEVEGFHQRGGVLERVAVAEVIGIEPHPAADKLVLAKVDTGGDAVTVVCGAPNCREGVKVPYAAVGTVFPDGFVLEPKEIRGVRSEGMLCSERELGLSENHEGLMLLPTDAPVGSSVAKVLNRDIDLVLDVDNKSLTHRPDLWGHFGMAREVAVVFDTPLEDPFDASWADALKARLGDNPPPVTLEVDPDSSNLGFLGLSVDGITIAESPSWMRERLLAAGMRPINNIVDISNYVMLELGMPNHIFDRDRISGGRIVVRRAGHDQTFTTLDEVERRLIGSDTLVCDANRPLAIAGVMGGLESSVAPETTRIMIEVANWRDSEIRKTSTRLGLRTDSSQRYEKSLDSLLLERTLLRILDLVLQLNPGARPVGTIQTANMSAVENLVIQTSPERLSRVLGEEITADRVRGILESLAFGVRDVGEGAMEISVPSWRATKDIECEADIVEEIGRVVGYDNIVPVSPVHEIEAVRLSPAKRLFRNIQDFLVLRGKALEVMTYPLVGEALLEKAAWPESNDELVLVNALTPEHDRMRPSLIPSLLQAAALNAREHEAFRLFETGRSYRPGSSEVFSRDRHHVGVVFVDESTHPFLELASAVESLVSFVGFEGILEPGDPAADHPLVPAAWEGSHPHEFLNLRMGGASRGIVLSVHPQVSRVFKIKGNTALAILDFTDLMDEMATERVSYRPLARYPGSLFDLTVVVDKGVHAAEAVAAVTKEGLPAVVSVKILDVFNLPDGSRAVTLRVGFRDPQGTLDGAFLKECETGVIGALDRSGFPLRA